eukprot:scaffold806_cov78-Skeletonema_dohrnii-CCMP3373.AAC.1
MDKCSRLSGSATYEKADERGGSHDLFDFSIFICRVNFVSSDVGRFDVLEMTQKDATTGSALHTCYVIIVYS